MAMKLKPVHVSIVGGPQSMMYGVSIQGVSSELLNEMCEYAKSIGGNAVGNSVWFVDESTRTLFLLRWQ